VAADAQREAAAARRPEPAHDAGAEAKRYLSKSGTDRASEHEGPPAADEWSLLAVLRRTLKEEFVSVALRNRISGSAQELQQALEARLRLYEERRPQSVT
jgi:hypothetical protein